MRYKCHELLYINKKNEARTFLVLASNNANYGNLAITLLLLPARRRGVQLARGMENMMRSSCLS